MIQWYNDKARPNFVSSFGRSFRKSPNRSSAPRNRSNSPEPLKRAGAPPNIPHHHSPRSSLSLFRTGKFGQKRVKSFDGIASINQFPMDIFWTPGATAWFMGTLQPGASIIPCLDETNEPRPKNRALQHVDCFAMPSNTKNLRTVNVMGNAVIQKNLRMHSQCSYFVPRIVESHVQPFCFWSCLSRGVTGQPN